MANIDRADWHYGGQYPKDLPPENGGTHIGMYLAWVINRDLGSEELKEYVAAKLPAFRRREITGRDLLLTELDEKFFSSLLSEEGQAFTAAYYESDQYVEDYAEALALDLESVYHVKDSWENYDVIARQLDQRLEAWRNSR
jgi:hypothetical protein